MEKRWKMESSADKTLNEWFYNLKVIDKLSLYEGCEKLGVKKEVSEDEI